MVQFYGFNNKIYNPYLYLSSGGSDLAKPLHTYGPAGRTGYMIHYVSAGKGFFTSNNKKYTLTKGAFFFIEPQKIITMSADKSDPWTTHWIRFTGKLATEYMNRINIHHTNPIFFITDHHAQIIRDKIFELLEISHMERENDFIYTTKLLQILDQLQIMYPKNLQDEQNSSDKLFTKAMQYIHNNYETPITVNDVVEYMSLDRTYLYKIFKNVIGVGPKEYLTKCRMRKARELLESTDDWINIIAYSCGYSNPLHFSRAFKQFTGLSPSIYRSNNKKVIETKN